MINLNLDYYNKLRQLAQQDLSLAHLKQHNDAAQLSAALGGVDINGIGTYSVSKPNDTIMFNTGNITGKKYWVSNLVNANYGVFVVKENNFPIVVLTKLSDQVHRELVPTLGMEATHTGHLTFTNHPAVKLFNYDSLTSFPVQYMIELGFVTNHLGLAESIFNDINEYADLAGINNSFERKKIELNLSILEMVWKSGIEQLGVDCSDHIWHLCNTNFALSKKTLTDICHYIIQFTGSKLFEVGTIQHQRFKDALIYSSHRRNLYFSLREYFA